MTRCLTDKLLHSRQAFPRKAARRYISRQDVRVIRGVSRTDSPATDYTDYTKKTPR